LAPSHFVRRVVKRSTLPPIPLVKGEAVNSFTSKQKGINMNIVLSVSKCLYINDLDRLLPCDRFFVHLDYRDISKKESFEMNRHDKETYKLIFDKLIGNDVMLAIDEDIYSEVVENLLYYSNKTYGD
jgi:hypothetical protein